MEKEAILKILEDYEYFVDDDWGGHYEHINCKQRALTPLGILEILDYIDNLETQLKKQKETINRTLAHLDIFISDEQLSKYDTLKILMYAKKILEDKEV